MMVEEVIAALAAVGMCERDVKPEDLVGQVVEARRRAREAGRDDGLVFAADLLRREAESYPPRQPDVVRVLDAAAREIAAEAEALYPPSAATILGLTKNATEAPACDECGGSGLDPDSFGECAKCPTEVTP